MLQLDLFVDASPLRSGMIAVMRSGERIAIWPNESEDPACFTGQLLEDGASLAQARVWNTSVMWLRSEINHVEPPTVDDQELSLIEFEFLAGSADAQQPEANT